MKSAMMKYILLLCPILLSTFVFGQSTGKVIYQEKFDLYRNLPPEREHMKDMIPHYNTAFFELVYNGEESIYQPQKEADETSVSSTSGGQQMTMRFGRDNRVVYKNNATAEMIDSRDFMQKQFLIKGPPTVRKWKIGKNQKEILGYNCLEASFQADSVTNIKAWFTPQLAISNGPSDFQGLPGIILEIDINDGERMTIASDIKLDSVDTSMIIAPTKGKEVTSEEFTKIREEKMKEMQMQNGGAHGNMIITRRN
ncbi:MAG: GLPGLI family protein [Bacteroidota bacterium]|nr:GLPGLI family protein [Bacteroidota bacterium]